MGLEGLASLYFEGVPRWFGSVRIGVVIVVDFELDDDLVARCIRVIVIIIVVVIAILTGNSF